MKWKAACIIFLALFIVETSIAKDKKKNKKITLSGYVFDGNEKPLQGINLFVDGEAINKVTNDKGFYKIKVKSGSKALMVYSPSHGGLEVEFGERTKINFILAPSTIDSRLSVPVNELVDIGYGKIKKSDASYNVGSLKNKESKTQIYTNIYEMIQDQFPGIGISGGSIVIRGGSGSIMGSNAALIIVDGVSTPSIADISPDDVENISILKGSATAIYGVRGANGVVLITTKGRK